MRENKLIAEFMGIESDNAKMRGHLYECPVTAEYVSNLEYHTSWDWLMPVVQKISSCIEEPFDLDNLKYAFLNNNIEVVYTEVVELIKELNKE